MIAGSDRQNRTGLRLLYGHKVSFREMGGKVEREKPIKQMEKRSPIQITRSLNQIMITRKPYRIRSFINRSYSITRNPSKINRNISTHDRSTTNVLKRNQRRLKEFENNIELAEQFKTHRQNVVEILKDEKHRCII